MRRKAGNIGKGNLLVQKKGELLLNGKRQTVARQKICKVVLNLDPADPSGDLVALLENKEKVIP